MRSNCYRSFVMYDYFNETRSTSDTDHYKFLISFVYFSDTDHYKFLISFCLFQQPFCGSWSPNFWSGGSYDYRGGSTL